MGEIATWSAVKTKVGLGKDSNECPTKAELLALSPTGTGENYVGLEISNASSYGNNETVQLSDIHKVTYKYTFSQAISTLSFTALGGQSTNGSSIFSVISTKRKYLDGIATGSNIEVAYSSEDLPDWIIFQDNVFKALENTDLSSRNYTRLSTQSESGKTLSGSFTQAAATQSWEYTLSHGVWNETDDLYTAIAGEYRTYLMDERSYKQEKRNGKNYGPQIPVPVTVSSDSTWLTLNPTTFDDINTAGRDKPLIQTFQENKTLSRRYATITFTQAESGKKFTAKRYQAAGVKTYGDITVTPTGDVPDIPASGGASRTFPYTWTQPWGWNGKTNDGGTLTTGGTETWNASVSGSNLGTTAKARTKLGVRTVTVTCNGKSGTATKDVYQAENKITNVTQGAWVVSISANPSTLTEMGGTSQISASARAPRTNTWSSGATNAASDATGTPTLSIPTASTGFSLSGTTLTVAENTTANQRSVVVRATMDTVYKEVTVTQSAYLVEWRYTLTTSTPTLNFDALGTTKSGTISSYREKYINGSLVEGSHEGVNIQVKSTSAEIQSATAAVAITLKENTTTQARTGTVVYEQVGSGKTVTITCSQAAGTVAIREELVIKESFPTAPNIGGTVKALVRSGYWDVVNGKDTIWHDDTPTVKTKPSFVSSTSVTYELGVGYRISATMPENTSESQLSGSLNLEYGSKTLSLGVKQAGASVAWSYELKVNNGTQDLNQQVPAKPSGTYSFTISSKRYKIVNGSVTSQSEDTTWTTSIPGSPSWIHVEEQSNTLIVTVDENTTTSQRSADIVIFQTGSSDTSITLTVEQQAASITWNYTFNIFQPSSKVLNVPAKMIDPDTIVVNSYRTKVINGTQTSTKEFVEVTIDPIEESWLEVTKNSNDQTQAELFVTCLENKVSSIRSATVTIRQVGTSNLDQVDINQSAATVSYNYYIGFNGNPDVGGYSMSWEYTQFGSSHGQSIDLKCWRKPVINGIESDTEEAAEYEVIFSRVGIDSFTVTNTPLSYDPTITTVRAYPKSINGSVFDLKGTVQYRIADYPSKSAYLYLTHKPVATVKRWTFQWYDQVESVTIKNVSHDSSAGSISPITIISKCEYLLASNQSQVAYTEYIKPNEDEDTATPVSWGRLVENGQTAQNDYDYAYLVDENKEDYDRQATRTFTQPGNPSNKRLYLYVTQTKPVTIKQEFHAELGNYYSYGDRNQIPLIYQWYSPDSSDTTDIGDMTPGGYTGVWCNLPATGVINCMITGKPQTGKPMKVRLSNLQARTIEDFDSGSPTEINKGLSVGYSQQDYQMGIEYSPGMNNYFLITPSILSESGAYGGGIRLEVSLRSSYSNNGTTIATVTLTPKNSDHPTIYFEVIYG
ncbi:MAG: hypothetical protein [Bacteriophage sp.]|nr:MAG: hypothetical protein [Bacteriophage sp.]